MASTPLYITGTLVPNKILANGPISINDGKVSVYYSALPNTQRYIMIDTTGQCMISNTIDDVTWVPDQIIGPGSYLIDDTTKYSIHTNHIPINISVNNNQISLNNVFTYNNIKLYYTTTNDNPTVIYISDNTQWIRTNRQPITDWLPTPTFVKILWNYASEQNFKSNNYFISGNQSLPTSVDSSSSTMYIIVGIFIILIIGSATSFFSNKSGMTWRTKKNKESFDIGD